MFLLVGLGNPGSRYTATRHNLGFRVVETLAQRWRCTFSETDSRYRMAEAEFFGSRVVLLEPLTYMNLSGEAVLAWSAASGYSVTPQTGRIVEADDPGTETEPVPGAQELSAQPIVVCDDLALPLGAVRIRPRGSAGGQKGLASIIDVLGTPEVPRVRLGVVEGDSSIDPGDWADYVLSEFSRDAEPDVDTVIAYAADAIECLVRNGLETAVSRFNCRQILDSALPDDE